MKRTKNAVMACLLFAFALFAVQSSFCESPPKKDETIKVYEKKNSICQVPVVTPVNEIAIANVTRYEQVKVVGVKDEIPIHNEVKGISLKRTAPDYVNHRIKFERPPAWQNNTLTYNI